MRIARVGNRLLITVHEAPGIMPQEQHSTMTLFTTGCWTRGPGHSVFFHSYYRLLLMFLTIFTSTITAFLRSVQFLIGGTLGSSLSDTYLSLSKT
jgi:hypothetical protein